MMLRVVTLLLVVLAASVFPAFGQLEGNPENWCRGGFLPSETDTFRLGTVKGKRGERVHFFGDEGDCPDASNCRLRSYLIPGDQVIVSRVFKGNWACSWFQPVKGNEMVGWLPAASLEIRDAAAPSSVSAWTGNWDYADASIDIKAGRGGTLHVTGIAIWKGLGDNVHVGEIDEVVRPENGELRIGAGSTDEYDCRATLRLVGRFMIVSDNLKCGGVNVTFSGVYRKK